VATVTTQVEAFLEQSGALATWLEALPEEEFGRPSVLEGWDVRTLVGHVVLIQVGLANALGQPSGEPAVRPGEYVTRYRPAVEQIAERTKQTTADHTPAELIALLRDVDAVRVRTQTPANTVVAGGRGPIAAADWATTRVVELVVHCDDLSRSLPERDAVTLVKAALKIAVRTTAEAFAEQAPGRSVELRVPPFVAVQAVQGPAHRRGTPPNVVETDAVTWLRLATGRIAFADEAARGGVRASGPRADLSGLLPVLS
jgi:uncharacterized protein (TIGR03083 family)